NGMDFAERRAAYACDITYGTNNEFGFDYLRDNMARHRDHRVQRGHHYAIIDEVDSVLIDEARTPLIISGPVEHSIQKYDEMKPDVERLVRTQGQLVNRILADAESRRQDPEKEWEAGFKLLQVKRGAAKKRDLERIHAERSERVHNILQLLRAYSLYEKDVEYVVQEEKILIVDEFTGRLMPGRRYSDGLHQAIEAKENVRVEGETQTL